MSTEEVFYALRQKGYLDEFICRGRTIVEFSDKCTKFYWNWRGCQTKLADPQFLTIDHWMRDKQKVKVTVEIL